MEVHAPKIKRMLFSGVMPQRKRVDSVYGESKDNIGKDEFPDRVITIPCPCPDKISGCLVLHPTKNTGEFIWHKHNSLPEGVFFKYKGSTDPLYGELL